ncbi:hypothetical protein Droror1_Dr00026321 [Drosera rotundifolia]
MQNHILNPSKTEPKYPTVSNRAFSGTHTMMIANQCGEGKEAVVVEAAMTAGAVDDGKRRSDEEESGRERLKRHRGEVAGQVWIPEIWGQEDLLKDWIDCSGFDAALGHKRIECARLALVEEGRRARMNMQESR